MARSDTRYREAYNRILTYCETLPPKAPIPSETRLAEIAGVSRTVIRRCLTRLEELGLISWQGRDKHLLRQPRAEDRREPAAQPCRRAVDERQYGEAIKGAVRLLVIGIGVVAGNADQHRRHAKRQRDIAGGSVARFQKIHVTR